MAGRRWRNLTKASAARRSPEDRTSRGVAADLGWAAKPVGLGPTSRDGSWVRDLQMTCARRLSQTMAGREAVPRTLAKDCEILRGKIQRAEFFFGGAELHEAAVQVEGGQSEGGMPRSCRRARMTSKLAEGRWNLGKGRRKCRFLLAEFCGCRILQCRIFSKGGERTAVQQDGRAPGAAGGGGELSLADVCRTGRRSDRSEGSLTEFCSCRILREQNSACRFGPRLREMGGRPSLSRTEAEGAQGRSRLQGQQHRRLGGVQAAGFARRRPTAAAAAQNSAWQNSARGGGAAKELSSRVESEEEGRRRLPPRGLGVEGGSGLKASERRYGRLAKRRQGKVCGRWRKRREEDG